MRVYILKVQKVYKGRIIFIDKSFSEKYHYVDRRETLYDVSFIGSYEDERMGYLTYLAENGIKVNVFGNMWEKIAKQPIHPNLIIHFEGRHHHAYRETINASKIVLGFLRKANADTQTSRTFEIPACGGFMLMQRTKQQTQFFKEAVEAEYFSNKEELLKKVHYYLHNVEKRLEIAQNGRKRCESSGYSYKNRARTMIQEIYMLLEKDEIPEIRIT
jgi:spore maturation protein CgeB